MFYKLIPNNHESYYSTLVMISWYETRRILPVLNLIVPRGKRFNRPAHSLHPLLETNQTSDHSVTTKLGDARVGEVLGATRERDWNQQESGSLFIVSKRENRDVSEI